MPQLKIRRYKESDNKDVWKLHILGLEQFKVRVHPDYQRKGYGQIILDKLEKRAAKLGYEILQLDTTDKQKPAQRFFEKNGYVKTKTERLEKYDLDMIYYKKKIK